MIKKLVLALSVSTLVLAPVQAADPLDGQENPVALRMAAQAEIVEDIVAIKAPAEVVIAPSLKQAAYDAFDGGKNIAYGVGNVAKAGGRVIKDVAQVGTAAVEAVAGIGHAVVAPFTFAYAGKEAAQKNLDQAKGYFAAAYENMKTVVADAPTNFANLKTAAEQAYEGGNKFVGAAKNVAGSDAAAAVKSFAGKAGVAVKDAAYKAGSVIKGFFVRAISSLTPSFDNVDFS